VVRPPIDYAFLLMFNSEAINKTDASNILDSANEYSIVNGEN